MEDKSHEECAGRWGEEEATSNETVWVGFSEGLIFELKPV